MNETREKAQAGFYKVSDVKSLPLVHGVDLKLIAGDNTMLSFVTLEPGAVVPFHSHPHEQMGTVLEGELVFYIGGSDEEHGRIMRPGETWLVPGNTLHGARNASEKPCVALDIFGPVREDYVAKFKEEHGHLPTGLHTESED
jgi:quercetin dioxygenase-like cupin family protein